MSLSGARSINSTWCSQGTDLFAAFDTCGLHEQAKTGQATHPALMSPDGEVVAYFKILSKTMRKSRF